MNALMEIHPAILSWLGKTGKSKLETITPLWTAIQR
jgi:hypothetical protein